MVGSAQVPHVHHWWGRHCWTALHSMRIHTFTILAVERNADSNPSLNIVCSFNESKPESRVTITSAIINNFNSCTDCKGWHVLQSCRSTWCHGCRNSNGVQNQLQRFKSEMATGVNSMARLWRNTDGTREGKYLVTRRDGTIPEWPYFVIGAADPAAPFALHTYADSCAEMGMDPEYVEDLKDLAMTFEQWRLEHGSGDPDAPRHRTDDPATIEKMKQAQGS